MRDLAGLVQTHAAYDLLDGRNNGRVHAEFIDAQSQKDDRVDRIGGHLPA